jgi:hypothetical protein
MFENKVLKKVSGLGRTIQERVVQLFSSVETRLVVPLDPSVKKPLLKLFFKTKSQFSLPLTILIQKLQVAIVYAQI